MPDSFDPYRKWLGIPSAEQPPHHYRLLGVGLFEDDPDVIESSADQRMSHLRSFQTGAHSALSQQLLNEVAAAKLCLLDPRKKAGYDVELRERLQPVPTIARPVGQAAPLAVAPLAVAPAIDERGPLVFTGSPVRGPTRNAASIRRRKPSLWPAAGVTALLAAIFVGYVVWTKPKPEAAAVKPSSLGQQPASAPPKPKSVQPKEKRGTELPAVLRSAEVVVTNVQPAEAEPASSTSVAKLEDRPAKESASETAASTSESDGFVPLPKDRAAAGISPAEAPAPAARGGKDRSLADLPDSKKMDAARTPSDKLTAEEAFVLKRHTSGVARVAFHPTLPLLASAGKDGRVFLWNLDDRSAKGELAKFNEEVWTVKFSPNGELLTFANRNWWGSVVSFRSFDGGREVKKLKDFKNGGGAVVTVAYSPDGRLFAASQDDGTIRLWETANFQEFPPLSLGSNVFSIAFGPITFDRKHKPAEYLMGAGCRDGTIRTLRVAMAKEKAGLRLVFETIGVSFPRQQAVISVRFSPDGKLLGAARVAGLISLYDAETGIAVREMRASNGNADWITFHPQRPWIATAHWTDRVARIWHQDTGAMLCELRGHTAGVFCAEFSRDGRRVATASDDFSVKLWDLVGPDVPEAPKRAKKGKPPTFLVGE